MNFEELMAVGQSAHSQREYSNARFFKEQAFDAAVNDVQRGRAMRDIAAADDRLGDVDAAWVHANEALTLHNQAVESGDRAAYRERAASGMYVGGIALRQSIGLELAGETASELAGSSVVKQFQAVRGDMHKHKRAYRYLLPDQYDVNIAGRYAMAEGLYGSGWKGIAGSVRAIGLGALSESVLVHNRASDMSFVDRLKAKQNGISRGVAALTVSFSAGLKRKVALKIADKAL
jgi:hypothetical protein